MAVQSVLSKTSMTLSFKEGVDTNGKDIIKNKKYSNVKVSATAQSILDVATALSPLMRYPVVEILRSDDNVLINA